MGRFEGKTAIVTGAAQGIGEVYARALASEGANVVVADIEVALGEAVAKQITADGGAAAFKDVDVSDEQSAKDLAEFTVEKFGRIDHLVNNAAIYGTMKLDLLITVPWDYYKKFMSVNFDGALNVTRAVWPNMNENGGGSIVNQSSTAAWLYSGFYGLAKVGVNGLTQQLAHELGGMNIRVNAIAPGPTDTEATRTVTPGNMVADMVKTLPLERMGTPDDLVGACLYLLSDDASWVTGQILNVDGGQIFRS
ncbi:SDR family oxidoreductase [Rhodococcus sp. NPDC058521]|uniref:SDR family oxidoreductase n=1 Tax=Rhodococcus sp. NPDC058521 TaxID=3346536 RepID=UPI00364FCDB0